MKKLRREQSRILKDISRRISKIEWITLAMVFGSFSRGDYGPKSDIDLFVLTSEKEKTREELIKATEGMERNIQPVIRTPKELKRTDKGLLKKVFREGKIILLRNFVWFDSSKLLDLKPFRIYLFDISKLRKEEKARFSQMLYGQKVGKYRYAGIAEKAGGIKLGSGCVLFPEEKTAEAEKFFSSKKIKPKTFEVFA